MAERNENSNVICLRGNDDILKSGKNFEEKLNLLKDKIREFLNLKNVYFLMGSGTSSPAIHTMKELCELDFQDNEQDIKSLYDKIKAKHEDDLEACLNILYSGRIVFEALKEEGNQNQSAEEGNQQEQNNRLDLYNKLIKKIELHIFKKINIDFSNGDAKMVLEYYKTFYQKLARRNRNGARICVFTTNNDLFNETAMDSSNINYVNGFSGGLQRVFNPGMFNFTWSKRMDTSLDKYEPIENLVYLYKIHGSINWREAKDIKNTYFEIEEVVPSEIDENNPAVLIYPTPTKQDKSLGSPYVDLFREFQHKLLEPHSVLFVIGYSFSDRHVNDIIYRGLATNSSLNVVVFGNPPDEDAENFEEEKRKRAIFFTNDNRVYIIHGKDCNKEDKGTGQSQGTETEAETDNTNDNENSPNSNSNDTTKGPINYFKYIVKYLLPELDVFGQDDNYLKDFVSYLKDVDRNKVKDEVKDEVKG